MDKNILLQNIYKDVLTDFDNLKIPYAKNVPIVINSRAKRRQGCCKKKDGKFIIEISEFAKHPQHQVSSIMMVHDNTLGGVKIPGLNQGHAFVLVSDTNKYRTD